MNGEKTKILLISASAKTGGGPSHIFLLNEFYQKISLSLDSFSYWILPCDILSDMSSVTASS